MLSRVSYTLNFDGSHNNQDQRASAGFIIRDNDGELVVAAAYNLDDKAKVPRFSVAIAEAIGLRNGLRLARECNLRLSDIEGDSQEVIAHVLGQGKRQPQPMLARIIEEIKENIGLASLQQPIHRADNKVADKLASMGSSLATGSSKVFRRHDDEIPPQIGELINQDKLRNGREDNRRCPANGIFTVGLVAVGAAALWGAFTQELEIVLIVTVMVCIMICTNFH